MTALPPPSRDPLLPGANRARPMSNGQPLPPPGSKQPTAATRPTGAAPRGDRGPVKAATVARWRRTWRSRLVATAGAAAGLIGGTAVIAHSVNADKVTPDTQSASETDPFEDVTTVPAPTAAPVVTAAPTVGTLPPTSAAATTTATTATPTTAAPVAAAEATVPATQAPATSRATTATTARTRQQQPASRSSGS